MCKGKFAQTATPRTGIDGLPCVMTFGAASPLLNFRARRAVLTEGSHSGLSRADVMRPLCDIGPGIVVGVQVGCDDLLVGYFCPTPKKVKNGLECGGSGRFAPVAGSAVQIRLRAADPPRSSEGTFYPFGGWAEIANFGAKTASMRSHGSRDANTASGWLGSTMPSRRARKSLVCSQCKSPGKQLLR